MSLTVARALNSSILSRSNCVPAPDRSGDSGSNSRRKRVSISRASDGKSAKRRCRSQRPRATYCASLRAVSARSGRVGERGSGVWFGIRGVKKLKGQKTKSKSERRKQRWFSSSLLPFDFRPLTFGGDDRERCDFGALLCGAYGFACGGAGLVGRGEKLFELAFD